MSFKDTVQSIFTLGLAAELDGIRAKNDATPERTAPAGTHRDLIPGLNFFGPKGEINFVLIAVAAAAVLGAIYLIRRHR